MSTRTNVGGTISLGMRSRQSKMMLCDGCDIVMTVVSDDENIGGVPSFFVRGAIRKLRTHHNHKVIKRGNSIVPFKSVYRFLSYG
jgi:hypothetical protein